jgi:hypothetical protein
LVDYEVRDLAVTEVEPEDRTIRELIDAGTDIAGAAVGAGMGLLLGGGGGALLGATGGAVVAHGLRRVALDIRNRILSPRETARVGAVIALAAQDIEERLRAGQSPRTDGFFEDEVPTHETSAEELVEGTLLVAQRAYEEGKIPFLGKLLATMAFDASLTPAMGHALLRLMDALTYRQLLILSIAGRNQDQSNPFGLRRELYGPGSSPETVAIAHEAYDLYQRALIYRHDPGTGQGSTVFGPTGISPSLMATEGMGNVLFRAARLAEMPADEVQALANEMLPQE